MVADVGKGSIDDDPFPLRVSCPKLTQLTNRALEVVADAPEGGVAAPVQRGITDLSPGSISLLGVGCRGDKEQTQDE